MIEEQISLDHAIDILNEAVDADPTAVHNLVEGRVSCNNKLADHPTIQVQRYDPLSRPHIGILGLLNGLFGANEKGVGSIAAYYSIRCPYCDVNSEDNKAKEWDGLKVGDKCPLECGGKLVLGHLARFERTSSKKEKK